jgi:hypothetical protein
MADFRLDRELVEAFEEGRLDQEGEAVLADQVARILPFHSVLPNPLAASLARVSQHLGGQQALLSGPLPRGTSPHRAAVPSHGAARSTQCATGHRGRAA